MISLLGTQTQESAAGTHPGTLAFPSASQGLPNDRFAGTHPGIRAFPSASQGLPDDRFAGTHPGATAQKRPRGATPH